MMRNRDFIFLLILVLIILAFSLSGMRQKQELEEFQKRIAIRDSMIQHLQDEVWHLEEQLDQCSYDNAVLRGEMVE